MKYLVIGATGTLGSEIVNQLEGERNEIVGFSRCELKQKSLARKHPSVKWVLGDVRDRESLRRAMRGIDVVLHCAALKHVDLMEYNPEECVATNLIGTINVADIAEECRVPHVVFSSTDKAVEPVNIYGASKMASERVLLNRNLSGSETKYVVYRWGNVLGSRGSVISSFVDSLLKENKVKVTDPAMTRFWIPIEKAVHFMLGTFENNSGEEVVIPPIKAATLIRVIDTIADLIDVKDYSIEYVGLRAGEKIHEVLSRPSLDSLSGPQYTDEELRDLLIPIIEKL